MKKIYFQTETNTPYQDVIDNFDRDLFVYLAPPLLPFNLVKFDGCKTGDQVIIELGPKPFSITWQSDITEDYQDESKWYFVDEGVKLPFPLKKWRHIHTVAKDHNGNGVIIDDINYSSGNAFLDNLLYPALLAQFLPRKILYKKFFENLK